jgi:hypothetical protein
MFDTGPAYGCHTLHRRLQSREQFQITVRLILQIGILNQDVIAFCFAYASLDGSAFPLIGDLSEIPYLREAEGKRPDHVFCRIRGAVIDDDQLFVEAHGFDGNRQYPLDESAKRYRRLFV